MERLAPQGKRSMRGPRPLARRPLLAVRLLSAAAVCIGPPLLLLLSVQAWVPTPPGASPARAGSRRDALVAAVAAVGAGELASSLPGSPLLLPAAAQQSSWQMQLPQGWKTFPVREGSGQIVSAGDETFGTGLTVLYVPLKADQDADAKTLVDYFSTSAKSTPPVAASEVANVLSKSQSREVATTNFTIVEPAKELIQGQRRYVYYDYISIFCAGDFTGKYKDQCKATNGDELPVLPVRHSIVTTVSKEDGQDILWLVDVSCPVETYDKVKSVVQQVRDSFKIGDEAFLEQERNQTIKKEAERLRENQKEELAMAAGQKME